MVSERRSDQQPGYCPLRGKDVSGLETTGDEPFLRPFGEHWVLYFPAADRLLVLNPSAKAARQLLAQGYDRNEVAALFAEHFGVPIERADRDVDSLLNDLAGACPPDQRETQPSPTLRGWNEFPGAGEASCEDCGTYRFGDSVLRIVSSVPEAGSGFFARFQHRAVHGVSSAELLQISETASSYRVRFRGSTVEEATTSSLISRVARLVLDLEHPDAEPMMFCHAAAVSRNGKGLVMPGDSGVGKSTLCAFLVAHGFAYLADDSIAIGAEDARLLPLPTCLSVKSGSWSVLEPFFPVLPELPVIDRYGRRLRYVGPDGNFATMHSAPAPLALVFPAFATGEQTRLSRLPALQAMIRLVGAHAALALPPTEDKLERLIRFVEETPAYELRYSNLPQAMRAVEDLLATCH